MAFTPPPRSRTPNELFMSIQRTKQPTPINRKYIVAHGESVAKNIRKCRLKYKKVPPGVKILFLARTGDTCQYFNRKRHTFIEQSDLPIEDLAQVLASNAKQDSILVDQYQKYVDIELYGPNNNNNKNTFGIRNVRPVRSESKYNIGYTGKKPIQSIRNKTLLSDLIKSDLSKSGMYFRREYIVTSCRQLPFRGRPRPLKELTSVSRIQNKEHGKVVPLKKTSTRKSVSNNEFGTEEFVKKLIKSGGLQYNLDPRGRFNFLLPAKEQLFRHHLNQLLKNFSHLSLKNKGSPKNV